MLRLDNLIRKPEVQRNEYSPLLAGFLGDKQVNYKIGDIIVHWSHGIGTVVALDQKLMAGVNQQYYVVEVERFKYWVPVEEGNEGSIRFPTRNLLRR